MTIAQQLNVKEFPFIIKDKNGNNIYKENSDGNWAKKEFDDKGRQIYYEDSFGYWGKRGYDNRNNLVYQESSDGRIIDNRQKPVPEYTMEELVDKLGYNFKIKK